MADHLFIAGHGSGDPGAVANGYAESDLLRKCLIPAMKKYSKNIDYITSYNVYAKGDMYRFKGYKTVTEGHFNAAASPSAYGTEVLIKGGFKPDSIDNGLLNVMAKYFYNRGIKYRNDLANVNRAAANGINYRLIEVCFITNKGDLDKFFKNLDSLARDLVSVIENRKIQEPKKEEPAVKKPEYDPITLEGHWVKKEWEELDAKLEKRGKQKLSEKRPDDPITRAEAVSLLNRILD